MMVSNTQPPPSHNRSQHTTSAMLSAAAQSYYAATTAALVNHHHNQQHQNHHHPTTVSSQQLLVHHPDYHHHHNNNNNIGSNNHLIGYHLATGNGNCNHIVNNNNNNNSSPNLTNDLPTTLHNQHTHHHLNHNHHNHHSHYNHHHSNHNQLQQQQQNQTNGDVTNNNITNNNNNNDLAPDRAIGYGAFGVVWSVTDPRDGKRVALKKMPNVFQNLISSKRVYREIKMLTFFKHENVLSALDILQPPAINFFQEIYVITELMESDLHKIIVSSQPLTSDHIKVFLYQILRGLKYLHSAKILHRDIKPGNLLVNSNCFLKICDFGLARVEENDRNRKMTQEVVTQYYRAPELLMGAKYYNEAIDMWSTGCIFAELLSRKILFQAQTPIQQLELIMDILGKPVAQDLHYACEAARLHVLRRPFKMIGLASVIKLSNIATRDAFHLLFQLLTFNPDKRIKASAALNHPYISEGRARYHSCMCKCCYTVNDTRRFCSDLEPVSSTCFDSSFEKELSSVIEVKERLHKEIMQRCMASNRVPLCINPLSASFTNFASSTVAHPSELPPSPHCWE